MILIHSYKSDEIHILPKVLNEYFKTSPILLKSTLPQMFDWLRVRGVERGLLFFQPIKNMSHSNKLSRFSSKTLSSALHFLLMGFSAGKCRRWNFYLMDKVCKRLSLKCVLLPFFFPARRDKFLHKYFRLFICPLHNKDYKAHKKPLFYAWWHCLMITFVGVCIIPVF